MKDSNKTMKKAAFRGIILFWVYVKAKLEEKVAWFCPRYDKNEDLINVLTLM